jgi:hypothetical protein
MERMTEMQKFGTGEVQHDPTDPQGVPVSDQETTAREASVMGPDQHRRDLDAENTHADAAPGTTEPSER